MKTNLLSGNSKYITDLLGTNSLNSEDLQKEYLDNYTEQDLSLILKKYFPNQPNKEILKFWFSPTDPNTLQSKKYQNVFVIGDATNLPSSKAGSVAHFQADILYENISQK